uniref:Tyrosine-protein kinase n=1 Tax=Scapholeberis mucronata TaxID=202097 RepID=A0A4Y7NK63_9CRUS|nr:EOG090X06CC [Scapholeberis mucronata]SVE93621.1 EOG090X06CC [Scapholeberis mucronata]
MSHLSIQQPPRNLPVTGPTTGGQLTSPNRSGGNILPQMGNNQRIGVLGQRAVGDKRPSIGYGQSMIGGSYFNLPASAAPSGLGPAGLAGVRGAFQGLEHGQGAQSQGVQGLQMPFRMPLGMDGSLAPPSLDLSEFPSLTNRSIGPNENGGSSSLTGRSNYVGIIKTPATETTEFTMSNEDFPALPGTQNNDNNTSTGSGAETAKVSNTTSSSSVNNTNLNHSKRGLQISSDGKVTNIPNNMVADQFGMAGLLTFIRVAESDSNLVSLALGSDLTTLGLNLNSPEPLYNNFGGPWAENPCRPQDIDFHVPPEYLTNAVIRDKLAPVKLNRYQEDLLFYLFYTNVGDTMQLAASLELYNRDWRYHKEERLWITRVPGMPLLEKTGTYERGTYYCFDPNNWRKVAKEMFVEYERLEDRPRDLQMPAMPSYSKIMGNRCCNKVPVQDQNGRKGSGNGESGLLTVQRSDTQYSGGGSSRLPSQDIIRHPPHSRPSVRLESPNGLSGPRMLIALYDYNAREISDMSFRKGDRMELLDDTDSDWWKAEHLASNKVGYIPRNFVAMEHWFFGHISRKEAEKLLLCQDLPRGAFLIRFAEHIPGGFSLTMRDYEVERGEANGLCHTLTVACPKLRPTIWDLSPQTRDKWEIDRAELEFIRKLGSGNFGEVWYGKWRHAYDVAIKTVKAGNMSSSDFLQEASIMKKFRHPNLVALYAVCSKEEPIFIVTEYMNKGSLLDLLRRDEGKALSFMELVYIAAQVASGMSYLESRQLIHRDLAARNVLVSDGCVAKICDFGLARLIKDNEYCPTAGTRFPVKWTAPEAALCGRFSIKSDVWSFGVLLMELFTYGQVPYPGMHNREVIENVEKGYRMPKPVNNPLPDALYRLMLSCWEAEPDKRPTFEFLHHFLEDFNITSEVPYREVND